MSNPFQNQSIKAQQGLMQTQPTQYPPYYPPPPPSWEQFSGLQNHIMSLQGEVIRLQRELEKIKNTKEWLVGPETGGADVSK